MIPSMAAVAMLALQPVADDAVDKRRDSDALGWWAPDYVKLQTGGYAGLAAAGVGYAAFDDVLNASLLYGYVPALAAGRTVHSLHFALHGRPVELRFGPVRWIVSYAGIGVLHTWGDRYFILLPARYAGGYYSPTGLHLTGHLGTEVDLVAGGASIFERHGLYLELCALEFYVRRYLRNPDSLGLSEVVSLAFGYRLAF